jgi:hypothetical protein
MSTQLNPNSLENRKGGEEMTQATKTWTAQANAEAQPAAATLNGSAASSVTTQDGAPRNGLAATNGTPVNGTPDVRPDVQETVEMAARIAGQRNMPLRVGAMSADGVKNGAMGNASLTNGNSTNGSNGKSEYSNVLLDGVPAVDILATLKRIAPQMKAVEREIERLITSPVKLVTDIAGHTLGAGGKRLRPALTIMCAQLCGDTEDEANTRAVTCAAVMELTHTTALIHDDVVDSAQTRRGKPAANLVWGNETSVLVGDYLCAQAFVTVARPEFRDVLPYIAQATAELCAGELLETQTRGLLSMSESHISILLR